MVRGGGGAFMEVKGTFAIELLWYSKGTDHEHNSNSCKYLIVVTVHQ